jgi:hypothetical protein
MLNNINKTYTCGCIKEQRNIAIYGDNNKEFYYINTTNCNNQHNNNIICGEKCSCFIKFEMHTLYNLDLNINRKIRSIMFQCSNPNCDIRSYLSKKYPNYWMTYLQLSADKQNSLEDINMHMFETINN